MSSLFHTPDYLYQSNIYEVNIRQYTPEGTFNAFATHLPRLKEMGIAILWLMPVHPIGEVKRKGRLGSYYSIKDHEGINPEFGTAADLTALITTAHALGMKVILDWVANHTAWDHVWTLSHPEYFAMDATGNFVPPYDWDDVIQIDHSNILQQEAMKDAMKFWIRNFDVDGFRADLAHLTPLPFWKEARMELTALKKDLVWLAETEDISYHEAFDISFTWEWMHVTEKLFRKEVTLRDCVNVLKKYRVHFPQKALRLFFTANHDENSWNGTEYEKYGAFAGALAVFSCTYPGIPLVYSGQELPNGKRLAFFEKDSINWQEEMELQVFYNKLLQLRKTNKAFRGDAVKISESIIEKDILAFTLCYEDNWVAVILNMGEAFVNDAVSLEGAEGKFRDIFSNQVVELNGQYKFSGGPGSFCVLEKICG